MNLQLLIDSIIRQTTVLIAQLATAQGVRAPLANLANQVFLDLENELNQQGVSRKVCADMFGMALRTYLRKIQRLSESSTERGRSLWEAVLSYVDQAGIATRADVLRRFHRDDEELVRGVLHDLCESALVFRTGTGAGTAFRVARQEELGVLGEKNEGNGTDELVWALIYREGPLGRETLVKLLLGCGIAVNPKADSESHFLGGCSTSCAPGLSCFCGVCSGPCVEASDCTGAALGAVCRALDAAQCGREQTAVCDVACALDDDCALVPGASCSSGWCRGPDPSSAIGAGPSVDENGGTQSLAPGEEESDRTPATPDTNELPALPDLNEYVWPPCYVNPAVTIADQAALARFEGCENIYGDLAIAFAADLRPLHALRSVFGSLSVHPLVSTQRSLEGLEGLELVQGDLRLSSLELPSLASLARLVAVGARPGQGLVLEASTTLHDLSGLEQLTNLHNLSISGAADLLSIAALQLPSVMERVVLANVPRLTSIESLSSVRRFDSLTLTATGLESLGLSLTPSIEQLSLIDNALLTDTSALLAVQSLRQLQIQGNARLTSIVFPRQVSSLESLSVADNPQLGTLTLFTLERLQELAVMRNSSLTSISLPLLVVPVQTLIVVSNASLPPGSLGSLAQGVAKAKIAGNQGEATELSPCPFGRDGYCDSPPTDTLCAANTDGFDCSTAR